jgi:hypothetical protein
MGPVARELLGEPTTDDKAKRELRFGTRGSLCINLAKGTWFCHETRACRQLSQTTLATSWTAARKLRAVFS